MQLIYPQNKKECYDRAIQNMIYALTLFSECTRDFCSVMNEVAKSKQKDINALRAFRMRGSLILDQTISIAAEAIGLLEEREKYGGFDKCEVFKQELFDLITDMEEYDKRINTLFKKCSVPVTSRCSKSNNGSGFGTSNVRIIEC